MVECLHCFSLSLSEALAAVQLADGAVGCAGFECFLAAFSMSFAKSTASLKMSISECMSSSGSEPISGSSKSAVLPES